MTAGEMAVDKGLRRALEELSEAGRLITTANGEATAREIGQHFDTAIAAIEALIEIRATDHRHRHRLGEAVDR